MSDNEPVAWAVALGDEGMVLDGIYVSKAKADEVLEWRNENTEYGARLIPLYRSPALTDAERFVLREVMDIYAGEDDVASNEIAAVIDGLLERTRNGAVDGCDPVQ